MTSTLDSVTLVVDDRCVLADDPLQCATDAGASVGRPLPYALERKGVARPAALAVMYVDATSLWQQGQADAAAGSGTKSSAEGLTEFASTLSAAASNAPIPGSALYHLPLASASQAIHAAIEGAPMLNPRLRLSPDTELLQGSRMCLDGCHFTTDGLDAAAKMWAERVKAQLPSPAP